MAYLRHYELTTFVPPNKMPLWVVKICRKRKADKQFHDHKYSEIVFIRNGSCEHLFEGETVPVKAGDLLVVHPGATHAFDKQFEKLEIVNILYDSRRLYLPILDGSSIPLFLQIISLPFVPTPKLPTTSVLVIMMGAEAQPQTPPQQSVFAP